MVKFVYSFDEGHKDMKNTLGGKGANLCEMHRIGLPVPPGFIIGTRACLAYYDQNQVLEEGLIQDIKRGMEGLESETGKTFGKGDKPLLVSVRSGAAVSMPGMMDTVLNLGLNDQTVEAMAAYWGQAFAYDAYRRFIQMFSDVVLHIDKYKFDRLYDSMESRGPDRLKDLVEAYKALVRKETRKDFPQNVFVQLLLTIEAVFKSWYNPRAQVYRQVHKIDHKLGTGVTIQSMVFGNLNDQSGTGVVFSRNPSTGEKKLFGEYLINAQGEDVVAGIRTPEDISSLRETMPKIYGDLVGMIHSLETHYRDMQDIEFTIEDERLYLLQTRNGKRTAQGAVQIAVDLVEEGIISRDQALLSLDPDQINQLLHPTFSEKELGASTLLTQGLPASPGAGYGRLYLDADRVKSMTLEGEDVILVRTETSPEDIEGMVHARGIITSRGGMTSHAAVVARGMGKPCVVGCNQVIINYHERSVQIGSELFYEGDPISIDGSNGKIYKGLLKAEAVKTSPAFDRIMTWADQVKVLEVRANADQYHDARIALDFGAAGIGLCRTEHMFFQKERMALMQALILAEAPQDRRDLLGQLKPHQRSDFYDLLKGMGGRPITIRLLDPPLHEFLPHQAEEVNLLAKDLGIARDRLQDKISQIQEVNPMLGHRGIRLAITFPEIYEMQMESICQALVDLEGQGLTSQVEIMLPLIGFDKEFDLVKDRLNQVAYRFIEEHDLKSTYKIGTMIEVPRAALTADEISKKASFFSFGTNDLTQMTLGFSRDDSSKFIHAYQEKQVFESDPFASIDQVGVGKLMSLATQLGRAENKDLKIGICGEHGGDPKSIEFCHQLGLDYVSCSPFRVPVARLAAAQTALKHK